MKKWVMFLFLAAVSCTSIADGKFYATTGYMPGIPRQRGIVVYRDGTETLIIDNYVKAGKGPLAWVVPVPAKPTNIQALDNGIYDSLDHITKPALANAMTRHDVIKRLILLAAYSILVIGFCVSLRSKNRKKSFIILALFIIPLLVIAAVLSKYQNIQRAYGGSEGMNQSITQVNSWTVGNYNVKTIKASYAEDLAKWLADNGYSQPGQYHETNVIKYYIKKGWYFVVAKIRNNAGGKLNPHPLAITFKTNRPVYPLKLTQYNSSWETVLELIVIADQRSAVWPRAEVFCSKLKKTSLPKYSKKNGIGDNSYLYYSEASAHNTTLGRGQLGRYLWDSCIVTKYQAKIKRYHMDKDVKIKFGNYRPYLAKYYTPMAIASLQFKRVMIIAFCLPIAIGFIISPWWDAKRFGIACLIMLTFAMALWPMKTWQQVRLLPDFMNIEKTPSMRLLRPYINDFVYFLINKKIHLTADNLEQQYLDFISNGTNYDGLSNQKGIGPNQYQIKNINGQPALIIYGEDGYGYTFGIDEINDKVQKYSKTRKKFN